MLFNLEVTFKHPQVYEIGPSAEQFFVHRLIIVAIHIELVMQPIVLIGGVA